MLINEQHDIYFSIIYYVKPFALHDFSRGAVEVFVPLTSVYLFTKCLLNILRLHYSRPARKLARYYVRFYVADTLQSFNANCRVTY